MVQLRRATSIFAESERNVLRNIKRTGAEHRRVPARRSHDVRSEIGDLAHRVSWKWVAHMLSPQNSAFCQVETVGDSVEPYDLGLKREGLTKFCGQGIEQEHHVVRTGKRDFNVVHETARKRRSGLHDQAI